VINNALHDGLISVVLVVPSDPYYYLTYS
jgi:hypothetical protein